MLIQPPSQEAVNGWVALLTPLAIATLTVVNVATAWLSKKRAEKASIAVAEVKSTLEITTTATTEKLNAIHTLVNSEYGIALRAGATALEKIAAMTKDSGDIETARAARQASNDHDAKQRALDTQNKKGA